MAEAGTKAPDLRERVRKIIFEADAPAGKAFDVALIITIIVSVLAVILDTIPSITAEQQAFLQKAEWVFTILFTVEYFTRLWCVESPRLYARSFFGIIDLISILPTYVSLIVPGAEYLLVFRFLRALRIFRILKLAGHVKGARTILQAMRSSQAKIMVFLFTILILVTIIGSVMYLVEGRPIKVTNLDTINVNQRVWVGKVSESNMAIVGAVTRKQNSGATQVGSITVHSPNGKKREVKSNEAVWKPYNEKFESIPKSIYWAIVTLTTVGYGDISPKTPLGQFLAAVVMIMGYSIIAVPTGIVSAEMVRVDGPFAPNTRSCSNCSAEGHRLDAQHCYVCGKELGMPDEEALEQWFKDEEND